MRASARRVAGFARRTAAAMRSGFLEKRGNYKTRV